MAKSYVVSGAKVKCTMGSVEAPLRVLPNRRVLAKGKPKANILDCKPMVNMGPFGVCKMTKLPCVPACVMWLNGKMNVMVQGAPALMKNSMAVCMVGAGILKLKNDGQ